MMTPTMTPTITEPIRRYVSEETVNGDWRPASTSTSASRSKTATTTRTRARTTTTEGMTSLGYDFIPGPFDVICSRGKRAKNHSGNVSFQTSLKETYCSKYANAESKLGKSIIVSEIISMIRKKSPRGGFVKQDASTKEWFEIGDGNAREKVSQWLRDALHGMYRSSANSKKRRREVNTNKMIEDMDEFASSDSYIAKRMRVLSSDIEREGSDGSDMYLMIMMTQANLDILKQLDRDSISRSICNTINSASIGNNNNSNVSCGTNYITDCQ